MTKPLFISIGPNVQADDTRLSLKLIFSPINWYNFRETEKLEKEFSGLFLTGYQALAVNSGRSAMTLILKSLDIKPGDEVCLQAFTCSAAVSPIIAVGAKPVFVDIDDTYNMDPANLEKLINTKTKAIIVQHSFGTPAEMQKISAIAKKRKITLIEDCAVSLGATYNGKPVGTFGKISFFSFGRDKIISGTFGGMILTNDKVLLKKITKLRDSLEYPGPLWTFQQLLNPVVIPFIKKSYFWGFGKITLGKIMLVSLQKIKMLGKAISFEETFARLPDLMYPKKLPGAVSILIQNQLKKLNLYNKTRREIANVYFSKLSKDNLPPRNEGSVWLRVPYKSKDKNKMLKYFSKRKIILGDWYNSPVYPAAAFHYFNYLQGSCPRAEAASKEIVNLPTIPDMSITDANYVCKLINNF